MPNHIKNRIELSGDLEMVNALIEKFTTEQEPSIRKTFDDKIICENKESDFCWFDPKTGRSINRDKSIDQVGIPDGYEPEIVKGFSMFPDFKKVIPPPDDPAYRDEPSQEVAKRSENWWYTWNIEHWGSKWGGYDFNREGLFVFTFETAWSGCPIIIEAMSRQFPTVVIKYSWADEDTGYNCGRSIYSNGLLEVEQPKGGTKEAYDIAFELRPDRKECYTLVNGKYEYFEKEEA